MLSRAWHKGRAKRKAKKEAKLKKEVDTKERKKKGADEELSETLSQGYTLNQVINLKPN